MIQSVNIFNERVLSNLSDSLSGKWEAGSFQEPKQEEDKSVSARNFKAEGREVQVMLKTKFDKVDEKTTRVGAEVILYSANVIMQFNNTGMGIKFPQMRRIGYNDFYIKAQDQEKWSSELGENIQKAFLQLVAFEDKVKENFTRIFQGV